MFYAGFTKGYYQLSDLKDILISVLKIYSANLSMVFAGSIFGIISNQPLKVERPIFYVSLVLSAIWNLVLIISLYIFLFVNLPDDYKTILDFQTEIAANSMFLVTGVLAFFFLGTKSKVNA
jgi:hypothetical protein